MKRPNPPIPMKCTDAWVIVSPWGEAFVSTVTDRRRDSINAVMTWWPNETWKQQYRLGYRCTRVTLSPDMGVSLC